MQRTYSEREIDHLARRGAALRLGWYLHAAAYVLVTIFLAVLAARSGRNWAVIPALAWGTGLGLHGLLVYLLTGGRSLFERLVEQERQRLALQRDPW